MSKPSASESSIPIQKIARGDELAQGLDLAAENRRKLAELFPGVVTETSEGIAVDAAALARLVGAVVDDSGREKFGLSWNGKMAAERLALTPSTGTLRPAPDESEFWDTTQNVFVEGDNLEVLKLIQKSYAGKVKLIYIDPPYNTGSDLVYPDDFTDSIRNYQMLTGQMVSDGRRLSSNPDTKGRYHTDWLNMLYPRLKLARELLHTDGVLFASIDDSESANLKCLLDDVFGPENFIDSIAVEMSTTSGPKTVNAQQGTIVKNVEFVHVYRRSAAFDELPHTPLLDGVESYDTHYSIWMNDDGTLEALGDVLRRDSRIDSDIILYGLAERSGFSVNNMNKLLLLSEAAKTFIEANLKRIARVDRPPVSASGRTPAVGRWEGFEADHRTYYLTTLGIGTVQALMPLVLNYRMSDDYKPRFGRTVIRGDLWKGFHQDMGNVAKEGGVPFANGKKPMRLIKQLIKWSNVGKDAIILDFFAGSGTTAHSVMQMNAEDGGSRRFVAIQLPEPLDPNDKNQRPVAEFCDAIGKPRIISEVTKERMRRAATQIKEDNSMFTGDLGFRVFKLDTANVKAWEAPTTDALRPETIEQLLQGNIDAVRPDRSEADLLWGAMLNLGLPLDGEVITRGTDGNTVYVAGGGTLLACFASAFDLPGGEHLAVCLSQIAGELSVVVEITVLFRDAAFGGNDAAKVNLVENLKQRMPEGATARVRSM